MKQSFFNADFAQCYALAEQSDEGRAYIELLEQYGYQDVTLVTAQVEQLVERADESYAIQDEVKEIRAIQDEQAFLARVKQLEARTDAQSFFTRGELFLFAHQYDEAIYCYERAATLARTQAVYWGVAGQTKLRVGRSPMEVAFFFEQAIALDPTNARWYWNKSLLLTQLYKDLKETAFLEQAIIQLEQAKSLCRDEQKSLHEAIEQSFIALREHILNS